MSNENEVDAVGTDVTEVPGPGEIEPEGPAEPGERENPLTLEEVHRQAFLNREQSAFGNDPTVATPGEEAEPQVSGPGDVDHVVTLAKYARQADVGEDAEDTSGVAGGGLVAVDRETGEPVAEEDTPRYLRNPANEIETNDAGMVLTPAESYGPDDEDDAASDDSEDLSKLKKDELVERAVAAGYDRDEVSGLTKAEIAELDL